MDFTLNTILGETLLARSCFLMSRAKSKNIALRRSIKRKSENRQCADECNNVERQAGSCVVSFQSKSTNGSGNKVLGSGLFSYTGKPNSKIETTKDDDDDETASTVDLYEDEFPVSAQSSRKQERRRSVQFEEELVTAIYTRPRTTKDEKYYLHYDEYDYMDFKLEYRDELIEEKRKKSPYNSKSTHGCYRRTPRKVSFRREVVESVHLVMDRNQRREIQNDLFYSEEEMRTFLDEFVASLQNQSLQGAFETS